VVDTPDMATLYARYHQSIRAFAADAALMSRAGWRVASQNYGGFQGGPTVLARHKPTQLTVVYERPPATPTSRAE